MSEELKPCPCCINEEEQDLSMPTACDGIEYVVCQLCGLRVDAESWDNLPRILEGYKLVPIEMPRKIAMKYVSEGYQLDEVLQLYKAMIEAAE